MAYIVLVYYVGGASQHHFGLPLNMELGLFVSAANRSASLDTSVRRFAHYTQISTNG